MYPNYIFDIKGYFEMSVFEVSRVDWSVDFNILDTDITKVPSYIRKKTMFGHISYFLFTFQLMVSQITDILVNFWD